MAEASANTSIWDFVLNYYGRKGVSEALVGLQDSYGIDVNMLLFLVWVAAQRRSLGADDVQRVSEASHAWQRNVVVPIRAVRRLLKENAPLVSADTAAAFRKKVQAVELEGEQAQLNAMAAMTATLTPRRASSSETAVLQSLEAFQHVLGKNFPASAIDTLVAGLREVTDGH
ncbi:MAG: TIGR02444 family protein [Xanthobacteraceae bacterium]|nr:TIGR02444 family protein [Xanthobacteraceae bacterium]MBV9627165.1 TIGR02444 family protein [Xanthobacteraceae bacterium]